MLEEQMLKRKRGNAIALNLISVYNLQTIYQFGQWEGVNPSYSQGGGNKLP